MRIKSFDHSTRTQVFRQNFIISTIFNFWIIGYLITLMELWIPHISWSDNEKNILYKTALKLSLLSGLGLDIIIAGFILFTSSLQLNNLLYILSGISVIIAGVSLFACSIVLFVKKYKTIEN